MPNIAEIPPISTEGICTEPPKNWIMPLDMFDLNKVEPKLPPLINPQCQMIIPEFYDDHITYNIMLKYYYSWMTESCSLIAYIDGQYYGIESTDESNITRSLQPLRYDKLKGHLVCQHTD